VLAIKETARTGRIIPAVIFAESIKTLFISLGLVILSDIWFKKFVMLFDSELSNFGPMLLSTPNMLRRTTAQAKSWL
jgi:hypothetical protein